MSVTSCAIPDPAAPRIAEILKFWLSQRGDHDGLRDSGF